MEQKKDFWIVDQWDESKGRGMTVKINLVLESHKSKFQQIDLYESECFGKMLVLDGVINVTEFDEFAYHEMIAHAALSVHPSPKKVLIIGGGDGGTAREVLKHHSVEEVDMCEIDREVIEVCKKHLPTVSSSFNNPKLKVFCEDGAEFIKSRKNTYDVIIVDSCDPFGPAEVLFKEQFYRNMFSALTSDGIAITQSESIYYDQKTIKGLFEFNTKIFPVVKYYYTLVPTYPSGTIGFSFCSKKYDPLKDVKNKKIPGLKYYNKKIHKASFVMPNFVKGSVNN